MVWGVIGLHVIGPALVNTFNIDIGLCLLNAGIILGLMAAPIMTTIAEDALKAVPDSYREAAEALGATRWQVVWRVVLPHARPGLSAAVLLGIGRAFGETIAVLMASGHAIHIPTSVFDSVRALTATIAAELGIDPNNLHQIRFRALRRMREAAGLRPEPSAVHSANTPTPTASANRSAAIWRFMVHTLMVTMRQHTHTPTTCMAPATHSAARPVGEESIGSKYAGAMRNMPTPSTSGMATRIAPVSLPCAVSKRCSTAAQASAGPGSGLRRRAVVTGGTTASARERR